MGPSPTYHPPEGGECETSVEHGLPLRAEPAVGHCSRRPRPSPMSHSHFLGAREVGPGVGEQKPHGKTPFWGQPQFRDDLPTYLLQRVVARCRQQLEPWITCPRDQEAEGPTRSQQQGTVQMRRPHRRPAGNREKLGWTPEPEPLSGQETRTAGDQTTHNKPSLWRGHLSRRQVLMSRHRLRLLRQRQTPPVGRLVRRQPTSRGRRRLQAVRRWTPNQKSMGTGGQKIEQVADPRDPPESPASASFVANMTL